VKSVKVRRRCELPSNEHVQSMPAEKAFVRAEERTTTRTVGSLAMLSKTALYSCHNLFRIYSIVLMSTTELLFASLRGIECVHGRPDEKCFIWLSNNASKKCYETC
jgi:hypothetical protein